MPWASFRFHLAMDTLASSYVLGTINPHRGSHPLDCAHTGRTKKMGLSVTDNPC